MKANKISTKLSEDVRMFLINMNANRIYVKKQNGLNIKGDENFSFNENLKAIVKYFKNNNNRYLELIEMEKEKC